MEPFPYILHFPYGIDHSLYLYYIILNKSSVLNFYSIFHIFSLFGVNFYSPDLLGLFALGI